MMRMQEIRGTILKADEPDEHSMPTALESTATEHWDPVRWQLVIDVSAPLQLYPNPR